VTVIEQWLSGYRDLFPTAERGSSLWPTERGARLTLGALSDRFAAYRAELVRACPAAGDDRHFQRELVHCCAFWLVWQGEWRLENARREDSRWGISTWRQRVLLRLDALADTTEEFNHLPAMGETARRCAERLRQIWPAEADQMPLYPAFRGEAA